MSTILEGGGKMILKEIQRSSGPPCWFQQALGTGPLKSQGGGAAQSLEGGNQAKQSCDGKTPSYSLQMILPPQWTRRTHGQTKKNYSWAFRSMELALLGFGLAWDPSPLSSSNFFFGTVMSILYLSYHCILEAHSLSCFTHSQLERKSATGRIIPQDSFISDFNDI